MICSCTRIFFIASGLIVLLTVIIIPKCIESVFNDGVFWHPACRKTPTAKTIVNRRVIETLFRIFLPLTKQYSSVNKEDCVKGCHRPKADLKHFPLLGPVSLPIPDVGSDLVAKNKTPCRDNAKNNRHQKGYVFSFHRQPLNAAKIS